LILNFFRPKWSFVKSVPGAGARGSSWSATWAAPCVGCTWAARCEAGGAGRAANAKVFFIFFLFFFSNAKLFYFILFFLLTQKLFLNVSAGLTARGPKLTTLSEQGCQMVYFQTKNPNLGNFGEN
jgi:hypothetical protein